MKNPKKTIVKRLEKVINNYNKEEYCECGCQGRKDWNHSAIGHWDFLHFVEKITFDEANELLRLAKLGQQNETKS